jgi:hypothetical protein
MVVIRDEKRIAKLKTRSQRASLIGFVFLLGGFVAVFINVQNLVIIQTVALLAGFSLSQYGIYLQHRYGRSPRPDEVLDDAIKSVARDGRMYHYVLPAPHVLLTRSGPIVFVLKYQIGKISAVGDKWRQTGIGFRRFFGQEGLGNPARDADSAIKALASYIREHAPDLDDLSIATMIVFTSKNIGELDVAESSIPAMHFSKVKGFMRQKGAGEPLAMSDYEALLAAFDEAAANAEFL